MAINHPSFGELADGRIIIFDTTLRDGEQSPGFSMNLEEKLRMAEALHELGADVLEAGFAIASPGDFDSVQSIAKRFSQGRAGGGQPEPRQYRRHHGLGRGDQGRRPAAHPHRARDLRPAHAREAAHVARGCAGSASPRR